MIHKSKKGLRELVYGINAVTAALESAPESIITAYILKGKEDKRLETIVHLLKAYGISMQHSSRQYLDERSQGGVHQGIMLEIKAAPPLTERDLPAILDKAQDNGQDMLALILDGVTDPHNLGACMRSAWGAGACCVIVPKDKSASFTAAAKKAASGAAAVMPLVYVTNLARTIEYLQDECDFRVVGMAGEAEDDIYKSDLTGALALVMGSEESGMRRLTREKCDSITKIPMAAGVESLNVSVAAGIALFEARRQRGLQD